VLAIACAASGQVKRNSAAAADPSSPRTGSTSTTYDETIRMLKTLNNADLARLFSEGGSRNSDLLAACRGSDKQIGNAAFMILQFLGAPNLESCAGALERRYGGLVFATAGDLTDSDVELIDRKLIAIRIPKGHKCVGDVFYFDDAISYALILKGSTRSKTVLLALENFCTDRADLRNYNLERTNSLIKSAKEVGHNLNLEGGIESAIRAPAFLLPLEARKSVTVDVLARTDQRILLEVSYHCGPRCGQGYYVVLRKDGRVWQYAVIEMAWIS
jgi:hypothetical protein